MFNATVQLYVPVPEKPPLWLEILRNPRYSNFIAASRSGKWPRFLVILRSWKLIDSIALVV